MISHAAATLYRVLIGFGFAVAIGLSLGVLMGRFRPVENFVLPLMSALMPIPSLAWVPVFILWFGLGNTVSRAVPDAAQYLVGRARGQPDLAARGERHGRERTRAVLEGHHSRRLALHHCGLTPILPALLDRGDRRRDAGRLRLGPGLGDLRRQGIPRRRRDASVADRDRSNRLCHRTAGVRLDRTRHDLSLGHGARGAGLKHD